MGKSLIIKGADFSANALTQVYVPIMIPGQLHYTVNFNNGSFDPEQSGFYACEPIDLTEFGKLKGYDFNLMNEVRIIVYSAKPTAENATSVYLGTYVISANASDFGLKNYFGPNANWVILEEDVPTPDTPKGFSLSGKYI